MFKDDEKKDHYLIRGGNGEYLIVDADESRLTHDDSSIRDYVFAIPANCTSAKLCETDHGGLEVVVSETDALDKEFKVVADNVKSLVNKSETILANVTSVYDVLDKVVTTTQLNDDGTELKTTLTIGDLANSLKDLAVEVASTKSSREMIEDDVATVKNYLSALEEDIGADASSSGDNVEKIRLDDDSNPLEISPARNFSSLLLGNAKKITGIESQITALSESVQDIGSKASASDEKLLSVSNSLTELRSGLSDLQTKVIDLKSGFETTSDSVSTVLKQIEQKVTKLSTQESITEVKYLIKNYNEAFTETVRTVNDLNVKIVNSYAEWSRIIAQGLSIDASTENSIVNLNDTLQSCRDQMVTVQDICSASGTLMQVISVLEKSSRDYYDVLTKLAVDSSNSNKVANCISALDVILKNRPQKAPRRSV